MASSTIRVAPKGEECAARQGNITDRLLSLAVLAAVS